MDIEPQTPQTNRELQTEARRKLRELGVEIDATDHREPTEIVAALAGLGIRNVATGNTEKSVSPAKRRAASPYLAF